MKKWLIMYCVVVDRIQDPRSTEKGEYNRNVYFTFSIVAFDIKKYQSTNRSTMLRIQTIINTVILNDRRLTKRWSH
jgi:hypothetical protein